MDHQHILEGIDPAVVRMAIAAPRNAPTYLKALIVTASKKAMKRRQTELIPLDELLHHIKSAASEAGYDLMFSVEDPAEARAKFSFQKLKKIINEVSEEYGVSACEIKSARRTRDIILPRKKFCYRAVTETGKSYSEVGRFCGGRDHTTILQAVRSYAELMNLPLPHEQRKDAA